jgi:hypothetical protein
MLLLHLEISQPQVGLLHALDQGQRVFETEDRGYTPRPNYYHHTIHTLHVSLLTFLLEYDELGRPQATRYEPET